MTKVKFASAAVRYFTERGLDPTKVTNMTEGIQTRTKVSEESLAIRKQSIDIGKRLATIMRERDATLYKLLQEQHATTIDYLQQIEANILTHQVAMETQVLSTLLERVLHNGAEATLNRAMLEVITLQLKAQPYSEQEQHIFNLDLDAQRDNYLLLELRRLQEKVMVPAPISTTRPAAPVPMPDAPSKSGEAPAALTAPSQP